MEITHPRTTTVDVPIRQWVVENRLLLVVAAALALLPFAVGLLTGDSLGSVWSNQAGNSRFIQGLIIEILILAIFALSYDLILGITGVLSFGHAMFFASGAYLTGIAFKTLGWGVELTLLAVIAAGIVQAALFAIVLPRVKGVTFALVTLGFAAVFQIIIQSREAGPFTGSDTGLQGVIKPALLDPVNERLRVYFVALAATLLIYFLYKRFVDSPTGKVCLAIRENENRALMLGYNTFYYKFIALVISSVTAAFAGMLHTIHQPLVSPNIASLSYTIVALLIILIGGVSTLSGALVGAAIFRLLSFFLDKWFGQGANFLLGAVYILLVLFLPYGVVGTWQLRKGQWAVKCQELFRRQAPANPTTSIHKDTNHHETRR